MKPSVIEVVSQQGDEVRVRATFDSADSANASRMVNRMLAYMYEVDSRSDDDLPQLLAEKLGADEFARERARIAPLLAAPFVVDALDFETVLDPQVAEATEFMPSAPFTLTLDVTRKPAFELSSYEPVAITLPKARYDDEEVAGLMAAIASEHLQYDDLPASEAICVGDKVVLDMETYGDYGPVLALCGTGKVVKVGEGWLAAEVDENLVGAHAGDRVRFEIQALTEASADEADAEKLTVTMNIVQAMRPEPIEMTDEWVASHIEGAETLAEFEQLVQDTMITGTAQPQSEEMLLARVAEELAGRLDATISDALYEQTVNDMLAQMDQRAMQAGVTFEDHLATMGLSMDTLGEHLMARARSQITQGFALDAYFRHFAMELEDSDIDRAVARLVGSDRLDAIDSFRRQHELAGKTYLLREAARRLKANSAALESAVISYV